MNDFIGIVGKSAREIGIELTSNSANQSNENENGLSKHTMGSIAADCTNYSRSIGSVCESWIHHGNYGYFCWC